MPDNPETSLNASELQMARAGLLLQSVPVLINSGNAFSAVNRSCYAAFHAIKAIEILDNYDSKKHSGLMANFRSNYIKPGYSERSIPKY